MNGIAHGILTLATLSNGKSLIANESIWLISNGLEYDVVISESVVSYGSKFPDDALAIIDGLATVSPTNGRLTV